MQMSRANVVCTHSLCANIVCKHCVQVFRANCVQVLCASVCVRTIVCKYCVHRFCVQKLRNIARVCLVGFILWGYAGIYSGMYDVTRFDIGVSQRMHPTFKYALQGYVQ